MICIGHRGAMGHEPENTLRSIRYALDLGVDWIEVDVFAAHGRLLVIHDDTLERTTSGHGPLREKSLEYLRSLDAGRGEKIPFLDEVFDLASERAAVNVELKGPNTAEPVSEFLEQRIAAGWKTDRLLVSSFDHSELARFKALSPSIPIGALIDRLPATLAGDAERLGAQTINPSIRVVNRELVEDAHRRGLKVFVYTVNAPQEIDRMRALGVDGVFTNYPERVIEKRRPEDFHLQSDGLRRKGREFQRES